MVAAEPETAARAVLQDEARERGVGERAREVAGAVVAAVGVGELEDLREPVREPRDPGLGTLAAV